MAGGGGHTFHWRLEGEFSGGLQAYYKKVDPPGSWIPIGGVLASDATSVTYTPADGDITKADGSNLTKAETARAEFERALHLFPPKESKWMPLVLTCSSMTGDGITDIWDAVTRYRSITWDNGYFIRKRKEQSRYWMHETIRQQLRDNFYHNPDIRKVLSDLEKKTMDGELSPFHSARMLLDRYFNDLPTGP